MQLMERGRAGRKAAAGGQGEGERQTETEKAERERTESKVLWFLSSYPKQVEVPTEAHPRKRYVTEQTDEPGGVKAEQA